MSDTILIVLTIILFLVLVMLCICTYLIYVYLLSNNNSIVFGSSTDEKVQPNISFYNNEIFINNLKNNKVGSRIKKRHEPGPNGHYEN